MGFLSKLFGQKSASADFSVYEKLIDQLASTDNLKTQLKNFVQQAIKNPKAFYDNNGDYMPAERGLTYPKDAAQTPKFVMIDTLQNNGEMTEADWKEPEEEIRIMINEIRTAKHYSFSIGDDEVYGGKDTGKVIRLIDEKELQPQGYTIEILDIGSDSYVFTIVPLETKRTLRKLFDEIS